MIKFLLLFISLGSFAHDHFPEDLEETLYGFSLTALHKIDNIDTLASIFRSSNLDNRGLGELRLGGRYRLHPNLKLGLSYINQWGHREDDEWLDIAPGPDGWKWKDVDSTHIDIIEAEVLPKFLLDFLPGERWILDLRTSIQAKLHSGMRLWHFRPGVTYFWFKNGSPFLNISLRYGQYNRLSLKNSITEYRREVYLSGLYHYSDKVKLTLTASKAKLYWGPSRDFKLDSPNETYKYVEDINLLTLGLIFKI